MPDVALNLPFDSNEVKEIAIEEFKKRLDGLGPLQGAKEYVKFALDFQVTIRVWRSGETGAGKETLAWGKLAGEKEIPGPTTQESDEVTDLFDSKDPNAERMSRNMPLTVETNDGKGGRTRRKVNVK